MNQMKGFLWLFALLFLAACTAAAGSPSAEGGQPYTDISPQELNEMLENKDFLLINTHIPFEGDLPETDFSLPYNQIPANLALLPEDKDAKLVLYCRSDSMSRAAAEELAGLGYTNLYNLKGGFIAWQKDSFPMQGAP